MRGNRSWTHNRTQFARKYLFRTFQHARTNSLADVVNKHLIQNWTDLYIYHALENEVKMTSKRRVISLIFVIKCTESFPGNFHAISTLKVKWNCNFPENPFENSCFCCWAWGQRHTNEASRDFYDKPLITSITTILIWPAPLPGIWIKPCPVIGYPSEQHGAIWPARDYPPRPAREISPKAIW